MMKKSIALLLAAVMLMSAAACSSSPAKPTQPGSASGSAEPAGSGNSGDSALSKSYTFDAGSSAPEGATIDKLMKHFVSEASAQSGGDLTINYYGASQLGGDADLLTSCLAGEVPYVIMNTSNVVSAVPQLAVFDMAGAVSSSDIMAAVLADSEFSQIVQDWFESAGLHLCFYCPSTYKWLISSKEVNSIGDLSRYTMRTLANPYQMAFWEGAKASIVQITASELYLAMQQGMADGCEMDLTAFLNFGLVEVNDHLYETRLFPHVNVCVMNLDLWNEMPSQDQEWFNQFFADINVYYEELGKSDDKLCLEGIEAAGVEIHGFNEQLFNDLQKVAEERVWPMVRENIGDEPVDAYLQTIEKVESNM